MSRMVSNTRAAMPWQLSADRLPTSAHDRAIRFDEDVPERLELANHGTKVRPGFDGDRETHLGRRDDVHRHLVPFEDGEQSPEEPVRPEHAGRRDLEDGNARLVRDGLDRAEPALRICRDDRARVRRRPRVDDADRNAPG